MNSNSIPNREKKTQTINDNDNDSNNSNDLFKAPLDAKQ